MHVNNTYFAEQSEPAHLVALLRWRAQHDPDRQAYAFLGDGDLSSQLVDTVTFAELDQQARTLAAALQARAQVGERVLLLFPPGLEFIAAYFGCLYAGMIAVPSYPPRPNRYSTRLTGIIQDSQPKLALTTPDILKNRTTRFAQTPVLSNLDWLDVTALDPALAETWQPTPIDSSDIAFLQYTSGSTGSPKGVMVSHANLMHNIRTIAWSFRIDVNGTGLFWLPNYHDMGLIGGILTPLYVGGRSILFAAASFLQRPRRWLQAISHYRATVSGAPNFAYQLCLDKITPVQAAEFDLSCLQTMFCGAEPIRAETLQAFADRFAPYGFNPKSFYPCYGLAENTLLVTGADGMQGMQTLVLNSIALQQNRVEQVIPGTPGSQTLTSCGQALYGQQVRIVDPLELTECPSDTVGEVWVHGGSVAQGYWHNPTATAETFQAYTQAGAGPYLRTGDLGFLHSDQLYITGRLKDLIIIHGRNHYPQDIEFTVSNSSDGLEPGMCAAFSVPTEAGEALVVVQEVTRQNRQPDITAIAQQARRAVAETHEIQLHALVLIKPLSVDRTSSGKIKRSATRQAYLNGTLSVLAEWKQADLPAPTAVPASAASRTTARHNASEIEHWLCQKTADLLLMPLSEVDPTAPFAQHGLDSVKGVQLAGELEAWIGQVLPATLVWEYPTIRELAQYLADDPSPADSVTTPPPAVLDTPIAVIGLGCRLPGAPNPDAFWRLLYDGVDAIQPVPADRWDVDQFYSVSSKPGKMTTRWGGFLPEVATFAARFFGISGREAARIDPQQRLWLEVVWEALEHAGQAPARLAGSATGVFVGVSSFEYAQRQFSSPSQIDIYAGTGNAHSIVANRVSYLFDLNGPSIAIDTACSSSLVAVHLAIQSLRSGESNLALAGGVNLLLNPELTIAFSNGNMMASDGHCKTFDAGADGYVRGEGCGVVVLKRLADAERDGDQIWAVLSGSATNQDGRTNGLTAPNSHAQQAVIRAALASAHLSPSDIDYIEAHGTGTQLGDPIEIGALRAVLAGTPRPQPIRVGSVKTNFGHLEAAAGIAGLLKTILSVRHQIIPPHLNLRHTNPHLTFDDRLQPAASQPLVQPIRHAGVSSFGFGGSNAHVIVSHYYPKPIARDQSTVLRRQLFTLSAQTPTALHTLAQQYLERLAAQPDLNFADICRTVNIGRNHFSERLAAVVENTDQLQARLQDFLTEKRNTRLFRGKASVKPPNVVFLFTGSGAQYWQMGRELYETNPLYRAVLDRCAALCVGELDLPLLSILGIGVDSPDFDPQSSQAPIHQLRYNQPALFALQAGLVEVWRAWGVLPNVVLGHSTGEYAAAYAAGGLSLESGLRLSLMRGRLMADLQHPGLMATVFAAAERVQPVLQPYRTAVSIAAYNAPENTVISGAQNAVQELLSDLQAQGMQTQVLQISQAAHSPLMQFILSDFSAELNRHTFQPLRVPFYSTVQGGLHASGTVLAHAYWQAHLTDSVHFFSAIHGLNEMFGGKLIFIELGPAPSLSAFAQRCLPDPALHTWLPSLRAKQSDLQVLLSGLGQCYVRGVAVNLLGLQADSQAYRIPLPTYPFERERYWFEAGPARTLDHVDKWLSRSVTLQRLPTALPLYEWQTADSWEQVVLAAAQHEWQLPHTMATVFLRTPPPNLPAGAVRWQVQLMPGGHFQVFGELTTGWESFASGQVQVIGNAPVPSEQPEPTALPQREPPAPANSLAWRDQMPPSGEPAQQVAFLTQVLRLEIARVLDLPPDSVPADATLSQLGLDSLLALEMRRVIQMQLRYDLPIAELLQGPTIVQLASSLQLQLSGGGAVHNTLPPIQAHPAAAATETPVHHPLSYNQQALWFLHELLPASKSFNVAGAVRLLGGLQVDALKAGFAVLIARHAQLRSTFHSPQGMPVQSILPTMPVPMATIDAQTWSETQLQAFLVQQAYAPFDLEKGPVWRLCLLHRSPQESILLLAFDHIVIDLWSLSVLVQELQQLYQAAVQGQTLELPPPPLEFSDFTRWEADVLQSPAIAQQQHYWLNELHGELPVLNLPTDFARPAVQTFNGDLANQIISPALTAQLIQLCRQQGVTLYMLLLAAFQTLLQRYSGQSDLITGSVLTGRNQPEVEGIVGYFINPVAMRATFQPDQTFVSFLQQTRQKVIGAFANPNYPLALLAQQVQIARDASRPPIFETMFIMQKALGLSGSGVAAFAPGMPSTRLKFGELVVESLGIEKMPAQFDLTLMVAETNGGLAASMHYATDLFRREHVQRLLAHFVQILQAIVNQPDITIASIPLLTVSEQAQFQAWNDTARPLPTASLAQLLAEQAQTSPEKTAVICGATSLTYATLWARATDLAAYLQQLGVQPGTLVGIYVERSADLLVAILAVLQTGGTYIPLDPLFPPSRLALMLNDAQPQFLLTNGLSNPSDLPLQVVDVRTVPAALPYQPVSSQLNDLLYLIYTSGSTGKPKGVQVTQQAVLNLLRSMQVKPGLQASDTLLAVTTFSFDIAVLELLLPLLSGGTVVLTEPYVAVDASVLQALLTQHAITVMQATPTTWQMLVSAGWQGKPDLKILCGGEALPAVLASQLLRRCAELWNVYGPTETTIWSTCGRVSDATQPLTIGSPIDNTEVLILDAQRQPVPVGVVGELYIAGLGLARGYHQRPDLTAERFVPHPSQVGAHMYATGDLARWTAQGEVVFLGRSDFQVKVRGYRIELGEIENVLAWHKAIERAVVVAQVGADDTRLLAYYTLKTEQAEPSSASLRDFLRTRLPDYMLPVAFIALPAFPLTPNGKVDRNALPQPKLSRPDLHAQFVPPQTVLQQRVADVMAQLLGIDQVGIHDSFFDLGGNSLLATRLAFMIRTACQVELPLRLIFNEPTIAGLSQQIAALQRTGLDGDLVKPAGLFDPVSVSDLNAAATLPDHIQTLGLPLANWYQPQQVFLTGATGFVGAFLLRDLLRQTTAQVHCLVRAKTAAQGLARLRDNLVSYGIWQPEWENRVLPVLGDLAQPRFGLTAEQFQMLAEQIDMIIHNGAVVNFVYSFAAHQGANVGGTRTVLQLATQTRLKSVHHISTLSILHTGGHDDGRVYAEDTDLDLNGAPFGGYAQSKWVAEKLVMAAGRRGVPVAIYRPGLVAGDSETGAWNTSDMMSNLIRACYSAGITPQLSVMVDVVPVNFVSGAIVYLARQPSFHNKIYHLANPVRESYHDLIAWIGKSGYVTQNVPYDQWRSSLLDIAARYGGERWGAFLPLLEEADVRQVFLPNFEMHNTLTDLTGSGLHCAPVGGALFDTYFRYFTTSGFLPAPKSSVPTGR
jgi:amino acid adenylation domain-containing protein/thioester reductase-like protein